MNTGETLIVTASRPTIFVNAKRALITVSTKTKGKQIEVTKTGELSAPAIIPKRPKQKTLLEQLQDTTAANRLKLFEHFELCCGMNLGQCICEAEIIETMPVKVIQTPTIVPAGMNDAMARFLAKVDSKPIVEEVEEVWQFTKDKVWYDDTNAPQRKQWLVGSKATFRIVEVNEFDYDVIERVSK